MVETASLERASSRPERKLVLLASRLVLDETGRLRLVDALTSPGLDPDEVLRLAGRHGVVPLVHRSLRLYAGQATPAALLEALHQEARSQALHSARLARELGSLVELLSRAGIRCVPYKGPALAAAVYGDVTLRRNQDLDILVAPAQLERTLALVGQAGYRLSVSDQTRDERRGREYHLGLRQDRRDIMLEVHWLLQAEPWPLALEVETLLAGSSRVPVGGVEVPALSYEDLLPVLAVHGAKHAFHHLLWICDIAETMRRLGEANVGPAFWTEMLDRTGRLGCRRMLLIGLLLAHELLDGPLPGPIARALDDDTAARRLASLFAASLFEEGPALTGDALLLSLRERRRDRIRYVRYRLGRLLRVATSPSERDRKAVQLPRSLAFLYFAVRPVRALWQGAGGSLREIGGEVAALLRPAAGRPARRKRDRLE